MRRENTRRKEPLETVETLSSSSFSSSPPPATEVPSSPFVVLRLDRKRAKRDRRCPVTDEAADDDMDTTDAPPSIVVVVPRLVVEDCNRFTNLPVRRSGTFHVGFCSKTMS